MLARARVGWVPLLAAVAACGGGASSAGSLIDPVANLQRVGDADAGYLALVNNGYVSCGIPYSAYAQVAGTTSPADLIPGRNSLNAQLPYMLTAFPTASGVEVVSPNCLTCHAGHINGQLVIGLGAADGDFTDDPRVPAQLAGQLITDPTERAEWQKFAQRIDAIGPYTITSTVGVNPADNLAAVLFAHRDQKTLAWSQTPLLSLPQPGTPQAPVVPVHVPPWWRMWKKDAMFYDAAGRGDHARIMMTASTLCTDTVPEAQAIDAYFPDVEAYILSLRAPAYPFPLDSALAATGRTVFQANCSRCHGTYGAGGAYPNLVVPISEVGTDGLLGNGATQFARQFVNWFNGSFYGQAAQLDPQAGYIAPPLDGIWATAPYLHNGSVPTLAALLDSTTRPTYWTRTFDSSDYDPTAVGFNFTVMDHGQAAETDPSVRKTIYDTTLPGYSNQGHTFGDVLSDSDRSAVIEYLKTL
jgi:mono/diheme cytochrome c family protein